MLDLIFKLDYRVVHYINAKLRNPFFDYLNIAMTYLGSDVFALGVILAMVFLPKDTFRPFAIHGAVTLTTSTIFVQILKRLIRRKRPFVLSKNLRSIRIGVDPYSFPSGHTTAAFALATSISLLVVSPSIRLVFLLLAFGVGFSRVYLAVHYPSDVLAGAFIGSSFAYVVHLFMPALSQLV
ncbi:phosphatase PAP2 family protein [Proteiniclasticum sp. QWL-01]|uniref:phosphatase PAP2 family protein n=1 Tax=Proteiniclasticum sp. QWL-01 TaxID=3036945 RepID=UPI002201318E|nr:phosphatase PAP2 family protein [Proteiniclasticum sp. QWL-01]UUM11016.1 phosphatase PAP2 family protein [Clostridiaceae bacterium HFYG-1003]WFF72345.1 phosphatase PAP2 family protein [Proteiniclasticum sp. QWL-01]